MKINTRKPKNNKNKKEHKKTSFLLQFDRIKIMKNNITDDEIQTEDA